MSTPSATTPSPFVRGGTQRRLEIASGVDEYNDDALSEEGRSSSNSRRGSRGSQSSVPSTTSRSSSTVRFASDEQQPSTPGRRSMGSRSRSTESLSNLVSSSSAGAAAGSSASFTNEEALEALASSKTSSKETKTKKSSSSRRSNKVAPAEESGGQMTPPGGRANTPSVGSTTPKSTASSTSGEFSSSSSSSENGNNGSGKARKLWKEGIITVVAANRFRHGAEHWRAMQTAVLGGNPSTPVTPTTPGSSSVTSSSSSVSEGGTSSRKNSTTGSGNSSVTSGGGGIRISTLKRSGSTTFNNNGQDPTSSSGASSSSSSSSSTSSNNNVTPRPPLVRGGSSRRDLNVVGGGGGSTPGGSTPGGGGSVTPVSILKKTPSGRDVSNVPVGGGGATPKPQSGSNEEIVRVAGLEKSARAKKTAPLWRWAFGMVQEENRKKRSTMSRKEIDKRTRIINERRRSRNTYLNRPRSESYENPGEILPYLYVGGQVDAEDLSKLKSIGITHVLNAAASLDTVHEEHFMYLRSDLDDDEDEDVVAAFDEAFRFIEDAKMIGGAVLVHCVAGMSCSVAIAVAWLVYGENVSLVNALNMVRGRRPVALPNVGFRLALAKFEVKTLGYSSVLDAKDDPAWNFEALRNFPKVPRKPKANKNEQQKQDESCCCVL